MLTRRGRNEDDNSYMLSRKSVAALFVTVAGYAAAENFLKDDQLVSRVEKRVHDLQPSRQDRKLDLIGWAPDILTAEKFARDSHRPVFLFTYDGDISTGRC
jgi:hypothetical protein